MKRISICAALVVLFAVPEARSDSNLNFGNLGAATQDAVNTLIQVVALGADHHPYSGATPLGIAVGLDVGLDLTVIGLPQKFNDALRQMGNSTTIPSAIPIPMLNVRKGLPYGVDVGFTFVKYSVYEIFGADVQFAFLRGGVTTPAVALRLAANKADLDVLHTRNYSIDLVASKNFVAFEPYAGVGLQFYNGDLAVPTGGGAGLPSTVSAHVSDNKYRIMFGLPLKFPYFHISPEYNYSFAGFSTYGLKTSLAI